MGRTDQNGMPRNEQNGWPRDMPSIWELVWWLGVPSGVTVRRRKSDGLLYVTQGYGDADAEVLGPACETHEEVDVQIQFLKLHGLLEEET